MDLDSAAQCKNSFFAKKGLSLMQMERSIWIVLVGWDQGMIGGYRVPREINKEDEPGS